MYQLPLPSTLSTADRSDRRRAVGYVRVSTRQQADAGVSIETQRARIAKHAEYAHLHLLDVYADGGYSGRRLDNRPAFSVALARVIEVRGVLVVYSLSRFARSTRDCLEMALRFTAAGVDLVSLTESIDTTTPHGRFAFTLMAGLEQLESDLISERVRDVGSYLRSQGRRVGKLTPFGWDVGPDGTTLVPNVAERQLLQRVHSLRSAGCSWSVVARRLASEGYRNRCGRAYSAASISRALSRPLRVPW